MYYRVYIVDIAIHEMNRNFGLFCLFVVGQDMLSMGVPQSVNTYHLCVVTTKTQVYASWRDVDTTSSTSRCHRCKRGMTGYRCRHDIDTISSTSRCELCKRGMTGKWWHGTDVDTMSIRYRQHRDVDDVNEVWQGTDVDTISIRYRQHCDVDDVNDVNEVWQANDDRVSMLTQCRYDIVNIAMSMM